MTRMSSSPDNCGTTSSNLCPYMVRCTTFPPKSLTLSDHLTPVSMAKSPPNLFTTERIPSSSRGSGVSTNIPAAPRARAARATCVVTLLSRSGLWPMRMIHMAMGISL